MWYVVADGCSMWLHNVCVVCGCRRLQYVVADGCSMWLHNSPTSGPILQQWKQFVSTHRKDFNPTGRFVVCTEHFSDDCFSRSFHVKGAMKRLVNGAVLEQFGRNDGNNIKLLIS